MRYIFLLAAVFSCKSESTISEKQQKVFEEMAQTFQMKYMAGSENCNDILNAIDENIQMSEIGFSAPVRNFTYEQLKQFCPHLPKKEVIETTTEQILLNSNQGYDYVSQLYLRKSLGDTVRETSSRIWEKNNGIWKIIQMNSSLNKAID